MKPKQPTASYNDPRKQREAVELAQRIISGDIGIVAGCRHLSRLGHDIVEDGRLDRDFVVVGALDSETDHLPLDDQRPLWDPTAFAEKQEELSRIEESARTDILAACQSIVVRFRAV